MTPAQVKAARALLGWSRDRLAGATNLPVQWLGHYENGYVEAAKTAERVAAIRASLEATGIEFTDGEVPGVKLRKVET